MRYLLTAIFLSIILSVSAQNNFKISCHAPSSVKSGTKFDVTINIEKPNSRDYAIFNQKFPKGFKITEKYSGEAIFSFEDNELSYKWIRLPKEKNIKLIFTVEIASWVKGEYTFSGLFTYFANNKRGSIKIRPYTIKFGKNEAFVEVSSNKSKIKEDTKTVVCERNTIIYNPSEKAYVVKINIAKNNVNNSAKIFETLPGEYKTEVIESAGATFKQHGNNVIFTWNKMPKDAIYTISYKIFTEKKPLPPEIKGIFKYVKNYKVEVINIDQL